MHPVKTKLILLFFLNIILLNVDSIAQIKTLKSNSTTSLDFSCSGDYMEIDGKKYFNNGTVFYCSTTGIGFAVEIFAFKEDGEAYPGFKFINANGELISAPHTAKIRKYHWEELRN